MNFCLRDLIGELLETTVWFDWVTFDNPWTVRANFRCQTERIHEENMGKHHTGTRFFVGDRIWFGGRIQTLKGFFLSFFHFFIFFLFFEGVKLYSSIILCILNYKSEYLEATQGFIAVSPPRHIFSACVVITRPGRCVLSFRARPVINPVKHRTWVPNWSESRLGRYSLRQSLVKVYPLSGIVFPTPDNNQNTSTMAHNRLIKSR